MLNREEVIQAVDLHRRSYNLLRWMSNAVGKDLIRFETAHDYMDEAEAAEEWIRSHYLNLPSSCRPPLNLLTPFARYFATYLTTSFDLLEEPGNQLVSSCGCYCPVCTYLVAAPNLKVKKLRRSDKQRARKIKINALQQLYRELNSDLTQTQAETLIDSEDSAPDVSFLAYGQQLVERTHGRSVGPPVLALWREIAWEKSGAPKKNFELDADDILRAEQSLVEKVAAS